jgi:hypothetical protein
MLAMLALTLLAPLTVKASEVFAFILQAKAAGDYIEKFGPPIHARTMGQHFKGIACKLSPNEKDIVKSFMQKILKPESEMTGTHDELLPSGTRITMEMSAMPILKDQGRTLRRYNFMLSVVKEGISETNTFSGILTRNNSFEWELIKE